MKREIWIFLSFLKDKLLLFLLFFFNTLVIILFFNLSLNSSEWFYPCVLSAFVFGPYIFLEYLSYRKIVNMCDIGETSMPDEVYSGNNIIKKLNSTLIKIYKNYNVQLFEEKQKNLDFSRFISQFIHAMKTPVTVINLAVKNTPDIPCYSEKECSLSSTIKDISEENQRQLEMLNNLLEYLRINEFNKDYKPVTVDLYSELIGIINSKKRSFIYNNVKPNIVSTEVQKAEVLTDSKWNAVMLEQIISNAIKYSNKYEDADINTAFVENSSASNKMKVIDFGITINENSTVLSIQDYGIGIPAQDLQKVMDPFFTGENGRKMKNATGIGLYIVKLISHGLGHEVILESEPGVGTRVSIIYHKNKSLLSN